MKFTFKNLLKNKYVLYLIALIAFIDILGYIIRQELSAVLFFYLICVITYYYNKNMTIVLGTALLVTTLTHLIKNMMGVREGLKDMKTKESIDDTLEEPDEKEEVPETEEEEEEEEGPKIEKKAKKAKKAKEQENFEEKLKNIADKGRTGYQNQKLTPGLYNMPNKKQLEEQLGKADEMEKAYDNLEKVIGQNGIKSMSDTTKELVKQQNDLLKGLKDITPALHEAMGAIGKIDLGGISSIFNKATEKTEKTE